MLRNKLNLSRNLSQVYKCSKSNITLEELELFYNQLTVEKTYLSNILSGTLQFVVGIKREGELAAVGGLRRRFGLFHYGFRVVKAKFQRRGLSSELTKEILNFARAKSIGYINETINKENIPAVEGSLKTGYKIIYESEKYYRVILPLDRKGKIVALCLPFLFKLYYLFYKDEQG